MSDESLFPPAPEHAALLSLAATPELTHLLYSMPSETTGNERKFLYKFFSSVWNGRGDVVEIGPFLGGTTRAIALGMADHPDIEASSVLVTLDRFKEYYDHAALHDLVTPLIASGVLPGLPATHDNSFRSVFESIHTPHAYFSRIRVTTYDLPDTREQLNATGAPTIPPTRPVGAVFIDGCKSWFGTKLFMQEMAPRTTRGTFFLYQDFAWYTCFWLPVFIGLFPEKFELWGHVDTTYVFRLKEPITAAEIENRFPDTPEEFGRDALWALFQGRMSEAESRGDIFGMVRAEMQLAGGLAYIGRKRGARELLLKLAASPRAKGHEAVIASALKSPTYRPDGHIFLPQK